MEHYYFECMTRKLVRRNGSVGNRFTFSASGNKITRKNDAHFVSKLYIPPHTEGVDRFVEHQIPRPKTFHTEGVGQNNVNDNHAVQFPKEEKVNHFPTVRRVLSTIKMRKYVINKFLILLDIIIQYFS